jgi:hypothetical protein
MKNSNELSRKCCSSLEHRYGAHLSTHVYKGVKFDGIELRTERKLTIVKFHLYCTSFGYHVSSQKQA